MVPAACPWGGGSEKVMVSDASRWKDAWAPFTVTAAVAAKSAGNNSRDRVRAFVHAAGR